MNHSELAPIILFAYNRLQHLKETISYLAKNNLANKSQLFVFSDGPRTKNDEEKVKLVREVIDNVSGFANVKKVYREENLGLAKSVISGVTEVINKYHSAIVVEDDLITSPNFLSYMNGALEFYKEEKTIFSITGYSLPLKNKLQLSEDVFFSPRAGSWGWATWEDRWNSADWNVSDFSEFRKSKFLQKSFNIGGEDLTPMLKAQMKGYIDSWAIRWCYTLFKNNGLCVYPSHSKVNLIEEGVGGTHVKDSSKYKVALDATNKKTVFTTSYSLDKELLAEMNNFLKPSLVRKIINYFKYDFIK